MKNKTCRLCTASFVPVANEEYCNICMPYHKSMEKKRNKTKTKLKGGYK